MRREADRLDLLLGVNTGGGDGDATYTSDDAQGMLRNVDDRRDAVVVINATGTIQMTNKVCVGGGMCDM